MNEITLRGLRFHALVGILPHERTVPQPIEVDLDVRVADGDALVDYRALYDDVARVVSPGPDRLFGGHRRADCDGRARAQRTRPIGARRREEAARRACRAHSTTPRSWSSATRMLDVAYVALGSNVGDRAAHLDRARSALAALPDSRVIAESSIEETEPIGPVEQGQYLNQMIALRNDVSLHEPCSSISSTSRCVKAAREMFAGGRGRSISTSSHSTGRPLTIRTSGCRTPSFPIATSGSASSRNCA